MRCPKWLCGAIAAVFPWPSRADRKAGVEEAREKAAEARKKAAEAHQVKRELQQIMARDHFAQAIVEGLMEHRDDRK
jgi:cellobiose-specific phosphotransferase system component IIA